MGRVQVEAPVLVVGGGYLSQKPPDAAPHSLQSPIPGTCQAPDYPVPYYSPKQ